MAWRYVSHTEGQARFKRHSSREMQAQVNTAGGTHHAFADCGSGFCLLNDIAVTARYLLTQGLVKRVLVVDLDVHQAGNLIVCSLCWLQLQSCAPMWLAAGCSSKPPVSRHLQSLYVHLQEPACS